MRIIKKTINLNSLKNFESPVDVEKSLNIHTKCESKTTKLDLNGYTIGNPNYDKIVKSKIIITIPLYNTFDVSGVLKDEDFEMTPILGEISPYFRNSNMALANYFTKSVKKITGKTESRLNLLKSYNVNTPYTIGINYAEDTTKTFSGVIDITSEYVEYVIGGELRNGNYYDLTGVIYKTYNTSRDYFDEQTDSVITILDTDFTYYTRSYTIFNTEVKALIKENNFMGIVESPKVKSNINIDRGVIEIFERHLRMADITNIGGLEIYNNNYYSITKQ